MSVIKQDQHILRKFSFYKSTHKSFNKLFIMFSVEIKSHTCDIFILPIFEKLHNFDVIQNYAVQIFNLFAALEVKNSPVE